MNHPCIRCGCEVDHSSHVFCLTCGTDLEKARRERDVHVLRDVCDYLAASVPAAARLALDAASRSDLARNVADVAKEAEITARAVPGMARIGNVPGVTATASIAASAAAITARVACDTANLAYSLGNVDDALLGMARAAVAEAEVTATAAVDAARMARTAGPAAETAYVADVVRTAAVAAVRALQAAERVFFILADRRFQARARVVGVARPPGALTRRLLAAGCALLPVGGRDRYAEEWLSLLTEVPSRRARAGHLLAILYGTPRQAWTLRRPFNVPPA